MSYLLDTNICVHFLRDKFNIVPKIREVGFEHFSISEITVFELYFGAEKSERAEESYKSVDEFVQGIDVIPIYPSLKEYAKEKNHLYKIGKPINDEFDLLIGVCAKKNNLTLITENIKDFKNIRNLKTENWIER